jgi:hypothetical protein
VQDTTASNTDCFLWRDSCFSSTQLIVLFGTKRAYLHLEKPKLHLYSYQELTQFSQGNNVLDASVSNTTCFFLEIHVYLQFSRIGQLVTRAYLHLEKSKFEEVSISQTYSILTGNQCATWCILLHRWFLWTDTCVSSTQLNKPVWNIESLSRPRKTYIAGSIPFKNLLYSHRKQCA